MLKKRKNLFVETLGSPVLRAISKPVEKVDDALRNLVEIMLLSMEKFNGIGIAAPQVGRNIRVIAIDVPEDSMGEPPTPGEIELLPKMPLILINPEVEAVGGDTSRREEGCLSVPGIWAEVERPERIRLLAETIDGEKIDVECGGLLGRCLQHEVDHLNGLTFIDRLDKTAAAKVEGKVKNLRREGGRNNYHRVLE